MNSSQTEDLLNTSDEAVRSILSTILNMNMWNDCSEKTIVNAINKLLSVSKSRLQGLEFLNLIISNCSQTIISENGFSWISHCLVKYSGDKLKELKLKTIGRIIDNCYEDQEFTKKFISNHISKVLDMCLSTHTSIPEAEAALGTLASCMKCYGSWFAPHKLRIENFIIKFLDNSSEQIVDNAAVAFHFLQQVGGAGTDGINHKNHFSSNFEKLCATVQKLFDKFFESETEIDAGEKGNQEVFEFTDFAHHSYKMLHITAKRIKNCLEFLKTMLLKGFPAEKEIKPDDILNIVTRGTAIHRCISENNENSLEDCQFSVLLNQVQIGLLQLLHVLICWLQANSLPFSFIITKSLIDCLNKTQNCKCFQVDNIYRETVYNVLACWIRISKGALHTHFQTKLVQSILNDITPKTSNVTLSLQSDISKNKSKKAKQKAVQERIIASTQGNTLNGKSTRVGKFNKEQSCIYALDTLKHLLIATILKLPPKIIQEVYNTVIGTLINLQISKIEHPYTNPECQEKLYEVLVAFYEQETLKSLPPLHLTIELLNKGINGYNRKIALTCEQGLSSLEKLCQPISPSLFMTDIASSVKKSVSFIDKEVLDEVMEGEDENKDQCDTTERSESEKVEDILDQNEECDKNKEKESEKIHVYEEDGGITSTEDIPSVATLVCENSVHIIDVQILKGSVEAVDSEETVNSSSVILNDKDIFTMSDTQKTDTEELDEETEGLSGSMENGEETSLSQNSEDIQVENEVIVLDEPPSKKFKTDELSENIQEVQSSEEDMFKEDDGFVDVVKDY